MTKKQRALEVIERLKKEYPDAGCTLDYDQAWKLLVSVRLAAQCTDARVNIVTDSKYVVDAITLGWARKWRAQGWMRNKKEKALNPDLWETLLNLLDLHEVTFTWVKGHAGHPENERCDELAVSFYQNLR